jgi:hypothetical protein
LRKQLNLKQMHTEPMRMDLLELLLQDQRFKSNWRYSLWVEEILILH